MNSMNIYAKFEVTAEVHFNLLQHDYFVLREQSQLTVLSSNLLDCYTESQNFRGQFRCKNWQNEPYTMLSAVTSGLNRFILFGACVSPHLDTRGPGLCASLILIHLALNYTILPRWKLHQMDS